MVWLDGKPTEIKTLTWPPGDPDLLLPVTRWTNEGWSILDDTILFWRSFRIESGPRTVIYSANTTMARETQAESVVIERIAELDYAAHRVTAVSNVGFVTAEWKDNFVHFRAHDWSGELLRDCECPAKASYGDLSVMETTVSLCITSTDPISLAWQNVQSDIHYRRLDYVSGYPLQSPLDLVAETIVTWDAANGSLRKVKIPQNDSNKIVHHAGFQYLDPETIVLAAAVNGAPHGAVLTAFPANSEDSNKEILHFHHSDFNQPDSVGDALGRSGTSTPGPITVHLLDNRVRIFQNGLLTGDIPSAATTRDDKRIYGRTPEGMRSVLDAHLQDIRTLSRFSISSAFPSVADTRVLLYRRETGLLADRIYVLDFNQSLLASLLEKDSSERTEWNEQLVEDRARVKVVSRRFMSTSDGEPCDLEYPFGHAPPEWLEHVDSICDSDEEKDDSDVEMDDADEYQVLPPGVEYDEAPKEHRDPIPFGYVQTTLQIDGVKNLDSLAIT
ncbi:hypothetical protein H0H93_008203, partial [Arthromyces matolae]